MCTETGNLHRFLVCEKTDEHTKSNYRGEHLGGRIATHILIMASQYTKGTIKEVLSIVMT